MILLDKRLQRMEAQRGTPVYDSLIAAADADLALPDERAFNALPVFCAAYLVTADPKYGDRAKNLALGSFPWPRIDNDFWDRIEYPFAAKVLSWCRDRFTDAEAVQYAKNALDDVYARLPEFSGKPIWGVGLPGDGKSTPANNYYQSALTAAMVGRACQGLDARADKVLEAIAWRYEHEVEPVLTTQCAGGGMFESTNYGPASVVRLAEVAAVLNEWDGKDRFAHPFWRQSLLWRIYSTVPTMDGSIPFGDQPRDSMASFYDFDLLAPLMVADLIPDCPEAQYARWWLANIQGGWTTVRDHSNMDLALIYSDPAATLTDYRNELSTYYFTPYNGYAIWRSSWSADATMVVTPCGQDQLGHMDEDMGSVWVYKAGPLLGKAGDWSHSGQAAASEFQNVPLIDGKGQQWRIYAPSSGYTHRESQKVQMQSRDSYDVNEIVCLDFSRRVEYDEWSGAITDRVVAENPAAVVTEQFHAQNWAEVPGGFEARNDRFKLLFTMPGAVIEDVNLGVGSARSSQVLRSVTARQMSWQIAPLNEPYPIRAQVFTDPEPVVLPAPTTETNGGTPVPVNAPTARANSATAATKVDAPAGSLSATISGLPANVTIQAAAVYGFTVDANGNVTINRGVKYQHGDPPGDEHMTIEGNKLTWPALDPYGWVVYVVGSDNLFDADLPIADAQIVPPVDRDADFGRRARPILKALFELGKEADF